MPNSGHMCPFAVVFGLAGRCFSCREYTTPHRSPLTVSSRFVSAPQTRRIDQPSPPPSSSPPPQSRTRSVRIGQSHFSRQPLRIVVSGRCCRRRRCHRLYHRFTKTYTNTHARTPTRVLSNRPVVYSCVCVSLLRVHEPRVHM